MTFYIFTLGCKVNQYESQIMHEKLLQAGYTHTEDKSSADIVVINSCTVTSVSDSKAVKLLHRIRRENPAAAIVLTGCMPQAFPQEERFADADIVLGNRSRNILVPMIAKFLQTNTRVIHITNHEKDDGFEPMTVSDFNERTRAFVKIEDGCNRFCSYCIIPYARGRVRSKPIDELKGELITLSEKGYKEIVLVGINLSAYGQEIGLNLADAIETACSVQGIKRVRLGSLEPERMDSHTISRLAGQSKLCPQFHLSLQSGCNATLKRMNRHYTAEEYMEIATNLRKAFPNTSITTDIMVGFPGETEEEFKESLSFAQQIAFAKAHVFAYSRRPGTVADKAPNQIEHQVKTVRSKEMIAVTEQTRKAFLHTQIGRTESVLFETLQNGYIEGYTKNYTPVVVKTEKDITGKIGKVKLVKADKDQCEGILLDGTAL